MVKPTWRHVGIATRGGMLFLLSIGAFKVVKDLFVIAGFVAVSAPWTLQFESSAPYAVENQSMTETGDSFANGKILSVPYVYQGETNWCVHASLAMVLQYYGKGVEAADVAEARNDSPDSTVGVFDILLGWLDEYISQWPDLSVSNSVGQWPFERYQEHIGAGEPVIASVFALFGDRGHSLVVIGYSETEGHRYLYIHDPSGYLTYWHWATGNMASARVPWELFSRLKWTHTVISRAAPAASYPAPSIPESRPSMHS